MAYRWREATMNSGDYVTPQEFNTNLKAVVGELNGNIDRDNLREGIIATSKLQQYSLQKWSRITDTDTVAITLRNGWVAITDLVLTPTAPVDEMLRIEASIVIDVPESINMPESTRVVIGIRVDGAVIAVGDSVGITSDMITTLEVTAGIVVPAGFHVIEAVLGMQPPSGRSLTINQGHRRLVLREGRA